MCHFCFAKWHLHVCEYNNTRQLYFCATHCQIPNMIWSMPLNNGKRGKNRTRIYQTKSRQLIKKRGKKILSWYLLKKSIIWDFCTVLRCLRGFENLFEQIHCFPDIRADQPFHIFPIPKSPKTNNYSKHLQLSFFGLMAWNVSIEKGLCIF